MELKTIESFDKTRIRYRFHKGRNPALIFIHGNGGNHSMWEPYLQKLQHHTLIALDLRSHGHSQKGDFSLEKAAKDILGILKKEKITKAIFIGNCLGAAVSLEAYMLNPSVIQGMVFTSMFQKKYIKYPILTDIVRTIHYFITKPLAWRSSHRFVHFPPYFNKKYLYFILDLVNTNHQVYFDGTAALLKYNWKLKSVKVPTLIFQGKNDPLTNIKGVEKEAKKNKYISFFGLDGDHFLYIDLAKRIIQEIKQRLPKWSV